MFPSSDPKEVFFLFLLASYSRTVVHRYQFNQSVGRKLSFFNQVVEVVVIRYAVDNNWQEPERIFCVELDFLRPQEFGGRRSEREEIQTGGSRFVRCCAHLEKNQASRVLLLFLHLYCLFIAPGADQRKKKERRRR